MVTDAVETNASVAVVVTETLKSIRNSDQPCLFPSLKNA